MKDAEELTLYERARKITILSQEETETHYIDTIRTYSGAIVVMNIPKYTPEEEKVIRYQLARALTRFAHPDADFETVEYMEIIL